MKRCLILFLILSTSLQAAPKQQQKNQKKQPVSQQQAKPQPVPPEEKVEEPFFTGEWAGQGEIAFEFRKFKDDHLKSTKDTGNAIFTRLETRYESDVSKHVLRFFSRVDPKDSQRDFVSFEDAYLSSRLGENQAVRALAGYKLFNWTATEAFHPADQINSRNYDSDLENLEKKGELTVELDFDIPGGVLSFYYWPRFEKPEFPGSLSRLGLGVNLQDPAVMDGKQEIGYTVSQYGAMTQFVFGDADITLHAIHHVDRNFPITGTKNYMTVPIYGTIPVNTSDLTTNPTPYYFKTTQYGGTLQWNLFDMLVKLEGAMRTFDSDQEILTGRGLRKPFDHQEVAAGLEYTFTLENGIEWTWLVEGNALLGVDKDRRAEMSAFQRDVLGGFRMAFNNVMGSELFVSMIRDIERDKESLYNVSYSQRLSDQWKIKTGFRVYDAPQKGTLPLGLETLNEDNHVFLNVIRYF